MYVSNAALTAMKPIELFALNAGKNQLMLVTPTLQAL